MSRRTCGNVIVSVGCPDHAYSAKERLAVVVEAAHHKRVPQRVKPAATMQTFW